MWQASIRQDRIFHSCSSERYKEVLSWERPHCFEEWATWGTWKQETITIQSLVTLGHSVREGDFHNRRSWERKVSDVDQLKSLSSWEFRQWKVRWSVTLPSLMRARLIDWGLLQKYTTLLAGTVLDLQELFDFLLLSRKAEKSEHPGNHAISPSYLGGRDWEKHGKEASLGKKLARPHLNQQDKLGVHTCDPSYMESHR
jgi:hypothetical protein